MIISCTHTHRHTPIARCVVFFLSSFFYNVFSHSLTWNAIKKKSRKWLDSINNVSNDLNGSRKYPSSFIQKPQQSTREEVLLEFHYSREKSWRIKKKTTTSNSFSLSLFRMYSYGEKTYNMTSWWVMAPSSGVGIIFDSPRRSSFSDFVCSHRC